jgi:Protein of unknown function (DUF3142)
MSLSRFFRRQWSLNVRLLFISIALMAVAIGISSFTRKRRPWPVSQVPVAFWAWRNQAPADADVREAINQAHARLLFLRAGQIDFQEGKLRRIRPVKGNLPRGIDLHLVYNATRSLLAQLENVDEKTLATTINEAFHEDAQRADEEHARVVGLQIDIDIPTRLLGRYRKTLGALRARLKPGVQLSITGLPTWMESSELKSTLAQVDFWIPQLYGAEIPEHSDQLIPISAPENVSRYVSRARDFDKPFYAGLAAFSWTLLYSSSGSLISLRGDMDPAVIASDANLELIEQRPFARSAKINADVGSEWRYSYRAKADGVTDELAMHAGDVLVVDVPSAESLRLSAKIVRELAGERLLGICVFRLPTAADPATLTIAQVASALADRDSAAAVEIRILPDELTRASAANWILEVKNTGAASAIFGTVKVDLQTDPGTVESLTPRGSDLVESLCAPAGATNLIELEPCSLRRANVIRFKPRALIPGQTVTARLIMNLGRAGVIPVFIEMQTDTGQTYRDRIEVRAKAE